MEAGKIKEDVHVAGVELARVRVEGGEAAEGTMRRIWRDTADHKKDSVTSE